MPADWKNQLYYGDNLAILREHLPHESVDLVYIDPPFNSARNYNVLFSEHSGELSRAQITAFEDTWEWGLEANAAYHELLTGVGVPSRLVKVTEALYQVLGRSPLMAYLVMMGIRLIEFHRVLKPTGTFYLHCDPTASHYLKLVLDAVFLPENFRSEITWKRTNVHSDSKGWSSVADIILCYVKDARAAFTWTPQFEAHSEAYVASKYRYRDPDGRCYQLDNMTSPNPRPNMMYEWNGHASPPNGWRYSLETMARLDAEGRIWYPDSKDHRPRLKRYLENSLGVLLGNVWTDIPPLNSQARERLGYPTQKPEALLERIIRSSSNEGDVVLDGFCGCGTTINVAERLKRRWIGVDITHLAISLMRSRLNTAFGPSLSPYVVLGDPKDLSSASALAAADRHQFEWWSLGLIEARPAHDRKKGADGGIDGRILFFDDESGQAKQLLASVKSGHVNVSQVRDLRGVLDRERAAIGVLVTLEPSTKPMRDEALSAGYYVPEHFPDRRYPRLQILTIAELLAGKQPEYPRFQVGTFKKAPRQTKVSAAQGTLAGV